MIQNKWTTLATSWMENREIQSPFLQVRLTDKWVNKQ